MDLDAKLVLSNKLVDELKYENESLKMHTKCLVVEPIAKKDENIYCNHVVVPDFVPIVCSTSKDKSVYIPLHKRNQKVERKTLKSKPPFKSQPKVLDGSKFLPTRLSSQETITSNNCSVWVMKGSYDLTFTLLVLDLIFSIFVGLYMH